MPLVTLISDYGWSDFYVALLKASVLSRVGSISFVDISHNIAAHDIMEASFYIRSSFDHFPAKSIHVCAVNVHYAKDNYLVVLQKDGHFFIGPNNGLFSLVFDDVEDADILAVLSLQQEGLDARDAITTCVEIALGRSEEVLTIPLSFELERKINLQPVITSNQIRATIIHIDHFGNVIVNLNASTFEEVRKDRSYAIYYKSSDPVTRISKIYSDVPVGDVCVFFNSIRMLEIAINMGNAHQLLGLNKNETIQINFY